MSVYEKKTLEIIGEFVVLLVNLIGWIVLAGFLIWGTAAGLLSVIPVDDTEEVTIEQAK